MGHPVPKIQQAAMRRRPGKALREGSRYTDNLKAYTAGTARVGPSTVNAPCHRPSNQAVNAPTPREFVKLGLQPSDQIAANCDSAIESSSSLAGPASQSQIAIAVISCLSLGAILGYNWSYSVGPDRLTDTRVVSDISIETATAAKTTLATNTMTPEPTVPVAPVQLAEPQSMASSAENTAVDVEKYLDEIEWLNQQNKDLQFELDVLNAESTDLNYELLQLELQVAALKLQSEPPTETRIVYNFVDTPIGDRAMDAQAAGVRPTMALQSSGPPLNDTNFSRNSDVPELPIDEALPEEAYLISNEELLNEAMSEDEREEMLWELYNGSQPSDSQVIYDPETGFYINPQFNGQDPAYSYTQEQDPNYIPSANDP